MTVWLVESLLAYVHIAAILTLVVFMTSRAALCRTEWFNAAVVTRLRRVDLIFQGALWFVLASGLARLIWGVKGFAWYGSQPLLWAKFALFGAIWLISLQATGAFRRWARELGSGERLPEPAAIDRARYWVLLEAHLVLLMPIPAVLVARGVGTTG